MVAGLLKFKEYFKDYSDSYVLIGGAACDIIFTENEADFELKSHIGITPLHVSDDISSLSAILLDDDYYQVLLDGRVIENGFSVLRPE